MCRSLPTHSYSAIQLIQRGLRGFLRCRRGRGGVMLPRMKMHRKGPVRAQPYFAVSTKWSFATTVYCFASGSAILYIVPSACFPWMVSTT
jgi:hypothetical protein